MVIEAYNQWWILEEVDDRFVCNIPITNVQNYPNGDFSICY